MLSQTFRDAVEITRGLGVRYLWIDSLCIFQDSEEDWMQEAAGMGDVYNQAFLTLAATSSTSGEGGLFQSPDVREIRVSNSTEDEPACWLRLPFKDELLSSLQYESPSSHQYPLPLLTRKWTFQERLLSRRILYFAEEELAWECRTITCCQCNHEEPHIYKGTSAIPTTQTPSLKRAFDLVATSASHACEPLDLIGYTLPGKSNPIDAYLLFWERIVQQYSQKKVTFPKDNLPALAGIARECANLGPGEYHAGIWEKHFPEALFWYQPTHMRGTLPSRPHPGHAPSWSWASAECPIEFRGVLNERVHVEMVQVSTRPSGPDQFGPVRAEDCVLGIDAPAVRATLHVSSEESPFDRYIFRSEAWPGTYETRRTFWPDFQRSFEGTEVRLVHVKTGSNGLEFLVLSEAHDGVFERVGFLNASPKLYRPSEGPGSPFARRRFLIV